MKFFCQVDSDGNIIQTSAGFENAPFNGAIEVPLEVWNDSRFPMSNFSEAWVYKNNSFSIREGFVPPSPPISTDERIAQLDAQLKITQDALDALLLG